MSKKNKVLCESFQKIIKKEKNQITGWENSLFEDILDLSIDRSGKIGEKFIVHLLEKSSIDFTYDADTNTCNEDGTYDIKILGKRVEVKTARM